MSDRITSSANVHVKRAAALLSKPKMRREEGAFAVEGLRLFLDTPESFIEEVFLTDSAAKESEALREKAAALDRRSVPVHRLEPSLFKNLSDTKTPQGVLAIVRTPRCEFRDLFGSVKTQHCRAEAPQESPRRGAGAPLILVLENIQDPGNLGTMFRTAEAAGVTGIFMNRGTADITNPKTVRSTMSAIFREPFCYAENEEDFKEKLNKMKADGIRLYAAHLGGTACYDEPDYRGGSGFLIGNEGNGLTEETAALADTKIRIPMCGKIESLNAAMAAGILMYEAARQRRKKKAPAEK